jgi:hypothetical protein
VILFGQIVGVHIPAPWFAYGDGIVHVTLIEISWGWNSFATYFFGISDGDFFYFIMI